jgi:hypothetical protein
MIGNENKTIGMIQVHRQMAGPFSLNEFMATLRRTFWGPEVHQSRSGPQFFHANSDLFSTQFTVYFYDLCILIEGFCKLFCS